MDVPNPYRIKLLKDLSLWSLGCRGKACLYRREQNSDFQDPVMKQGAHKTIKSMVLIAMLLTIDKVNSISRQNLIF